MRKNSLQFLSWLIGLVVLIALGLDGYSQSPIQSNPIHYYKYPFASQMDILKYWAPRVYHDVRNDVVCLGITYIDEDGEAQCNGTGYKYFAEQDMITKVDFDGDWDATNNWEHSVGHDEYFNNGQPYAPPAYAYCSFIETKTHYFLGYYYFHPTDDADFLNAITDDRHENDMEEVFLVIKKRTPLKPSLPEYGEFEVMLTHKHGDWPLYSAGTVNFTNVNGQHPHIYISSNGSIFSPTAIWNQGLEGFKSHGHGIEKYDKAATGEFGSDDGIIYNVGDLSETPTLIEKKDDGTYHEYSYSLIDINELWTRRLDKSGHPFIRFGDFAGEGPDGKATGAHTAFGDAQMIDPARYFYSNAYLFIDRRNWSFEYDYNPYYNGKKDYETDRPNCPDSEKIVKTVQWPIDYIGVPEEDCHYYVSNGTFVLGGKGMGADGTDDQISFAHWKKIDGDFSFTVQLKSLQRNIDSKAMAGIMIRKDLESDAQNIFLALTDNVDDGVVLTARAIEGGSTLTKHSMADVKITPIWLRLEKFDDNIKAYYGYDLNNLILLGQVDDIFFDNTFYVGMAAASHNPDWVASAVFEKVNLSSFSPYCSLPGTEDGITSFTIHNPLGTTASNSYTHNVMRLVKGKNEAYISHNLLPEDMKFDIWIDADRNEIFDPGETYGTIYASANQTISEGEINIPASIAVSNTVLRLVGRYSSDGDPVVCLQGDIVGFSRDYSIEILDYYCANSGNTEYDDYITNITLGSNPDQTPVTMNYVDNFHVELEIITEQTEVTITVENASYSGDDRYLKIWIDFDNNSAFDQNEVVFNGTYMGYFEGNLTIPNDKITRQKKKRSMRIIYSRGYEVTDPCESFDYGQVLDYTVVLKREINPRNILNESTTTLCSGEDLIVSLDGSDEEVNYIVLVNDKPAKSHRGTGHAIDIHLSPDLLKNGDEVRVVAAYGDEEPMEMNNPFVVQINGPSVYNIMEGYHSFFTGNSITVTLDDSDPGVLYEVFVNEANSGTSITGTGDTLEITLPSGKFKSGDIITVKAVQSHCNTQMKGSAFVEALYCATGGNSADNWIERFEFGNHIDNTSGNDQGYGNFTYQVFDQALPAVFNTGASHNFKFTSGFLSSYSDAAFYYSIWIDYNQDGDFADDGERVYTSGLVPNYIGYATGSIEIQAPAKTGYTRMRITKRVLLSESTNPCSSDTNFGEAEDYLIFIDRYCQALGDTGSPHNRWLANVEVDGNSNVTGNDYGHGHYTHISTTLRRGEQTPFTLTSSASGYTQNFRIYIDYNQDGDFTDVGEAVYAGTGTSFVTGNFVVPPSAKSGPTRMRIMLKALSITGPCENGFGGESEDYTIVIDPYCESQGTTVAESRWLHRVEIGDMINLSGNDNGYGDHTHKIITASPSDVVPVTLTSSVAGSQYFNIYADYNQNGVFTDAGENVYSGTGDNSVTGSFVVPASAVTSTTRLRVILKESAISGPCEDGFEGDTEDYTLAIEAYCKPAASATSLYLKEVQIGSMVNTTGNDHGYRDYTNTSITVEEGEVVPLALKAPSGQGSFFAVFIDYNHDADFYDAGEKIFSASANSVTSSFVVPPFNEGPTRLRVIISASPIQDPCADLSYGAIEDYTLVVLLPYCEPVQAQPDAASVAYFEMGDFSTLQEGSPGYQDFTGTTIHVDRGGPIPFTITATALVTTFNMYVDFNRDNDFTDPGEWVHTSAGIDYAVDDLLIPQEVLNGPTRMRIIVGAPSGSWPCPDMFGAIEDYTLMITQPNPPIGQAVWLRGNNSLYVSGENGTMAMQCNRPATGVWEQFTIVDAGEGKVALKSMNKYVSSENGVNPITCNRTSIGAWEKFDWIANSDGTVSFRGNNGKYISSENGATSMTCNRTSIGAWEKFGYGIVSGGSGGNLVQEETANPVEVYPNPTATTATVKFDVQENQAIHIALIDLHGNVLEEQLHQNKSGHFKTDLDLSRLPSGLYVIHVQGRGFSRVLKVVKR